MDHLAPTDVATRAVTKCRECRSYSNVAAQVLKVNRNRSVTNWRGYLWRRGQGKIRPATARDDRFIALQTLRNMSRTVVQTRNELEGVGGTRIKERSVRRRFNEGVVRSRIGCKRSTTPETSSSSAFARKHQNFKRRGHILFADEDAVFV
ncbi:hypothetical protein JTB14_004649 [Gonioctena quinquepunctata]|nr:hypothetical protein JTB14_004649 [Gonioctena quinquepunctata]